MINYYVYDSNIQYHNDSFLGCTSLEEINLPQIKCIDMHTFAFCSSLKEIKLPECLEEIYFGAFLKSGIENLTLPEKTTVIMDYAFAGCEKLKSITLSDRISKALDF